jgi:hypothetical protein
MSMAGRSPPPDRFGGGDGEAAGEHREPAEPILGQGIQKVVAPGDGGVHGAVVRAVGVAGGAEQGRVVQAVGDLGDAQHGGAGGGQLDREREAVEAGTEGGDAAAVAVGETADGGDVGAVEEQADGVVAT